MSGMESRVVESAEYLLGMGEYPTAEKVAESLGVSVQDVELELREWLSGMQEQSRGVVSFSHKARTSVPDALGKQVSQLWELALDEAMSLCKHELSVSRVTDEEERRAAGDMVRDAEGRYRDLERRFRDQSQALDQQVQSHRTLEAEINVLKANLATETNLRKKQEQQRANAESELSQLRKQHEESKKVFDQRIKEEQRQALDAVSRAEVETRHYRNALEKVRDDAGRSEAELTRSVHELQGQVARKDARIDMQEASIKDLESELEDLKQSITSYSREIATLNSRMLRETNANRRFETQIKEQEEEIRRLNQRQALATNEASKRENALRQQVKEREEQVTRSNARINSLEKRVTTQEDQIRRLNARL